MDILNTVLSIIVSLISIFTFILTFFFGMRTLKEVVDALKKKKISLVGKAGFIRLAIAVVIFLPVLIFFLFFTPVAAQIIISVFLVLSVPFVFLWRKKTQALGKLLQNPSYSTQILFYIALFFAFYIIVINPLSMLLYLQTPYVHLFRTSYPVEIKCASCQNVPLRIVIESFVVSTDKKTTTLYLSLTANSLLINFKSLDSSLLIPGNGPVVEGTDPCQGTDACNLEPNQQGDIQITFSLTPSFATTYTLLLTETSNLGIVHFDPTPISF